jgi:hypothetical protein
VVDGYLEDFLKNMMINHDFWLVFFYWFQKHFLYLTLEMWCGSTNSFQGAVKPPTRKLKTIIWFKLLEIFDGYMVMRHALKFNDGGWWLN